MSVSMASTAAGALTESDAVRVQDDDGMSKEKSLWVQTRQFVFHVLFVVCKEVEPSAMVIIFGMLTEFFQLVSFPMDSQAGFPWNTGTISWLSEVSRYFRLYPFWSSSASSARSVWYIIVGLISFYLIIGAWVGSELSTGKPFKYVVWLRILRSLADLFAGSLFIPIAGTCFQLVRCSNTGNASVDVCGSSAHLAHAVLAMFVLALYLMLAFTLAGTFFARLPVAAAILSRPDARGHLVQLSVKLVLTGVFVFLAPTAAANQGISWALIAISLICTLALATYYARTLPYYRYGYNIAHSCLLYGAFWCSFCCVLVKLVNYPQQPGVSLMFLLAFPFAIFAASMHVKMRRASVENATIGSLQSAIDVELKARFVMESITEELRAALVNNVELVMDEAKKEAHANALAEAMRILTYGTKRFPVPAMFLVQAQYIFSFAKNKGQGLIYLSRAEQRDPALDELFTCFFYRKQNEESFASGELNAEVIQYLSFQQTLSEARRYDESATRFQAMFWEELLKQTTETSRMNDIAIQLNTSTMQAQQSYQKLMRMNPNSTQVLRMYASFLIDIANENIQGNRLISRADEMEDARAKSHERGESASLFDDGNALLSISGELTNMGEILDANLAAVRLFGYARADLMGNNINVIMPQPYSAFHQDALMKYMETGETTVINKNRQVFGLHRSGWLVPIDLFVREVASADGMTFLGVMRVPQNSSLGKVVPLQQIAGSAMNEQDQLQQTMALAASQGAANLSVNFAFVDASNQRVLGCTVGCSNLFGVTAEEVRASTVDVTNWVPLFRDQAALKEIRSAAGLHAFVKLPKGREVYMHLMQVLVKVGNEEFYLTHFAERQPPAGSHLVDDDDDDEDEDEEEDDGDFDLSDDEDEDDEDEDEEDDEDDEEDEEDEEEEKKHSDNSPGKDVADQKQEALDGDADSLSTPSIERSLRASLGHDSLSLPSDHPNDNDDIPLLSSVPLPNVIEQPAVAGVASTQISAGVLPPVIGNGPSPAKAAVSSSSSSAFANLPSTIKGTMINGVQVLSLSAESLALHDATFGNKEIPLFDKGDFKRGGVMGGRKGKKGKKQSKATRKQASKIELKNQAMIARAQQAMAAAAAVAVAPAAAADPSKPKPKKKAGFADVVEVTEVIIERDEEEEENQNQQQGEEHDESSPLVPPQNNPLFKAPGTALKESIIKPQVSKVPVGAYESGNAGSRPSALRRIDSDASAAGAGGAFGNKARKAGSVSSKSSGSSKSGASSMHNKLASFARAREGTDLTEGIKNLRLTLVVVLTFVVAIAIIREFVLSSLNNAFVLRLDTLYQSGERRYLNWRLAVSAHMLVQMATTTWSNFWQQDIIMAATAVKLHRDADALTWINNVLYIQRRSQLSPSHLRLYVEPVLTTFNVHDQVRFYQLGSSLWDAQQNLISAGRSVADEVMQIRNIYDYDITPYYLLRNAVANQASEFFNVINNTCFYYQEDSDSYLVAMRAWSYVFLFAGILSVFLVSFLVVRPRVQVVEKNKEDVLLLFGDIPFNLLQAFHQKITKRLNLLRAAMNGEDAEVMQTGLDEVETDPVAIAAAALSGGVGGAPNAASIDVDDQAEKKEEEHKDDDEDDDEAEQAEGAKGKGGMSMSERALLRAQKNKKRIVQNASFLSRNITMVKISFIVAVTIVYFAVSFMVQFGWVERKMVVAPAQINWAQHRRLSTLQLVWNARRLLTQNFWKLYQGGSTGLVDVTATDFFRDLELYNDIEIGLAFGSDRFRVDPPSTFESEQGELLFRNACYLSTMQGPGTCQTFAHGVFSHGLHAAVQEFINQARSSFADINGTQGVYSTLPYLGNSTWLNDTTAQLYLYNPANPTVPSLYKSFHSKPMEFMYNASETYLDQALNRSSLLYRDSVSNLVSYYQQARVGILVAFCLVCFFMYVLFYNPMCWQLDAEQKRTSAMLLIIPPDVMERLPTIREFVAQLGTKN